MLCTSCAVSSLFDDQSRFYSTKRLTIDFDSLKFNHMVEHYSTPLDSVFHALADATRRQMLQALAQGERTVTQLAEPFDMSLAAASKHIKTLEGAGLLRREIRGRTHLCRIEARPLAQANEWIRHYEHFWGSRLDALEQLLRANPAKPPQRKGKSQ